MGKDFGVNVIQNNFKTLKCKTIAHDVTKNILKTKEKLPLFFWHFLNIFKNNFYMVIKRGSNGKRHYILPVCNVTCLNLSLVFAVSFTPRTPILGRSVESRTPLEEFFFFLIFAF